MSTSDAHTNEIVTTDPTSGRRLALVVGCNNSSSNPPNWATLQSAEKDASDVAYLLEKPACNFKLLKPAIIGKDATAPNIRQAVRNLVKGRTEHDFLLFYFSGHAQPMKHNEIFFVTYDLEKEEVELDPTGYLSMRWLWNILYQGKGAGSVLIILDCCYAGNLQYSKEDFLQIDLRARLEEWDTGTDDNKPRKKPFRLILAATGYNVPAEEINEHGQMTKWLLQALEGNERIMDMEGIVDAYTLHKFLLEHMPQDHISPLSGEIARNCILARYPHLSVSHRKAEERPILEQIFEHVSMLSSQTGFSENDRQPNPQSFDKSLCSDASFDELDSMKITDYLNKELVLQEENFLPGLSSQEQLLRLGLFRKSYPTYGTLLCFAQDPSQWVPSAFTRCIDSSNSNSPDKWQASKKYRKGLLSQFEEGCNFLIKRLDSSRVVDKEGSTEQLEIPFAVLREALANALVHRDYQQRADSVVVEVFSDRVEISSPGDLPQGMTLENLQREHGSHPRNPQIADIFHLYGHVEERGKGVERMQRFMIEVGLPEPKFDLSEDKRLKVTLYRPTKEGLADVCVVCATVKEANSFVEAAENIGAQFKRGFSKNDNYAYFYTTIQNNKKEPLRVCVFWSSRFGPLEFTLTLLNILREYKPRLVVMTGTCAGDRNKVALGDIIVADRTFQYDTGKITLDEKGYKVHTHDTTTYMVDPQILRFVQMFDKWKRDVSNLKRPHAELLQDPIQPPRRHIAPIASSSAIRSDNPFSEIQVPVRGTIAVDMEGAAFYRAAQDFPGISSLLVKGVSDFADSSKHDNYQEYASAASAIYALSFIREYVTHELIPTTELSRSPSLLPYRLEETPEAP